MARSRSRALWSYIQRHRFRPAVRLQAHMVRRMQRQVAWGWAAAPRHPGMRPPEGTPGITKLRWGTASFRAAIFLAALIFLSDLAKPVAVNLPAWLRKIDYRCKGRSV